MLFSMKIVLIIALVVTSFPALSLETDNYLSWKIELKDSVTYLNEYFQKNISEALVDQKTKNKTCEQVTISIGKQFASHLVHDNPVENWLFETLSPNEISPDHLNYIEESVYREPYRFYIPWFGLAPNIRVNGVYMGTDKLSHFASTGMIYYKTFLDQKRKGAAGTAAESRAILWGIRDEKTVHGYWSSGVFSFADLEANYQGLKFYRRFCEGNGSYLAKNDEGNWILRFPPDLREYISGLWDETFERSYLLGNNWELVAPILKNEYCQMRNSPHIKARFARYQKTLRTSFSQSFLNDQKGKLVPDPEKDQSFSALCSGE